MARAGLTSLVLVGALILVALAGTAKTEKAVEAGLWDPAGTYEQMTGGRVFATALGVLMLEQPYRHRRLGR